MEDILDILIKSEKRKLPEKEIKLKRLSKEIGKDIIFKIKALPFDEVADITSMSDNMRVQIVLSGVINPNLKSTALMDKYGVPTPEDVVKKMFLAGEIDDISREIEKLSGYRESTVETLAEVKKK